MLNFHDEGDIIVAGPAQSSPNVQRKEVNYKFRNDAPAFEFLSSARTPKTSQYPSPGTFLHATQDLGDAVNGFPLKSGTTRSSLLTHFF